MADREDYYAIFLDPVDNYVGSSAHHKFANVSVMAYAAKPGMAPQSFNESYDAGG